MDTEDRFTVAISKGGVAYMFFGVIIFLLLPVPFTIFQGIQHIAFYIISALLAVPFGWAGLYYKTYKIIVNGRLIEVQKGLFKKFNIDVANIDSVVSIISLTSLGKNENVTVRVGRLKFKVETLMKNSEKMIAYLKDNVDESKIKTKTINFLN